MPLILEAVDKIDEFLPITSAEIALLFDVCSLLPKGRIETESAIINPQFTGKFALQFTPQEKAVLFGSVYSNKNIDLPGSIINQVCAHEGIHMYHILLLHKRGLLKQTFHTLHSIQSSYFYSNFSRSRFIWEPIIEKFKQYPQLNELRFQLAVGTLEFGHYDFHKFNPFNPYT